MQSNYKYKPVITAYGSSQMCNFVFDMKNKCTQIHDKHVQQVTTDLTTYATSKAKQYIKDPDTSILICNFGFITALHSNVKLIGLICSSLIYCSNYNINLIILGLNTHIMSIIVSLKLIVVSFLFFTEDGTIVYFYF